MNTFVITVIFVAIAFHGCVALLVIDAIEGGRAEIKFPYSCESTYVTLQHVHKQPFYISNYPELTKMSPNHFVGNHHTSESGDGCALNFIINPVNIDDDGGYIFTVYKNGRIIDDQRFSVHVKHPPGKASCESRTYIDENWVSLYCTATLGTTPGQIMCFQTGMRMPPLPDENDETLNYIMLVRNSTDHVYCCSSAIKQTKDRCECKDWGWDPISNTLLDISNPCPTSTLTPVALSLSLDCYNHSPANSTRMLQTTTGLSVKKNSNGFEVRRLLYIIIILVVILIIFVFLSFFCHVCRGICTMRDYMRGNKGSKEDGTKEKNFGKETDTKQNQYETVSHESEGDAEEIDRDYDYVDTSV